MRKLIMHSGLGFSSSFSHMNSAVQEHIGIPSHLLRDETIKRLKEIIPLVFGQLSIEKAAGIGILVDAILYIQGHTPLANMLGITGTITIGEMYLVKKAAGE